MNFKTLSFLLTYITATTANSLRTKGQLVNPNGHPTRRTKNAKRARRESVIAHVFTTTNSDNQYRGNEVVMYNQMQDGSLEVQGRFPTGGSGSGHLPSGGGPDPLGSQGPLIVSNDHLITLNALEGQISVFRIHEHGLDHTDLVSTGNTPSFPVGLAVHDDRLVYALDAAGTGTVIGYKLQDSGRLELIEGSKRVLPGEQLDFPPDIIFAASQVGFTESGEQLVVILKDAPEFDGQFPGRVLVFSVNKDGTLSDEPTITEIGTIQFAFVVFEEDHRNYIVATDPLRGALSSYEINQDGSLSTISQFVNSGGQIAPCWVATSGNIVYSANLGSDTISSFRINEGFTLTLKESVAATHFGGAPLDLVATDDYLYQLFPGTGTIGVYELDGEGSLDLVGQYGGLEPFGDGVFGTPVGMAVVEK